MNPIPTKSTVWVALAVIVVHGLLIAWALRMADRNEAPPGPDPVVQRVQLLPARADTSRKEPSVVVVQRAGPSKRQAPSVAAQRPAATLPPANRTAKAATGPGAPSAGSDMPAAPRSNVPALEAATASVTAAPTGAATGAVKGSATAGGLAGVAAPADTGAGLVQQPDAFAKYLNNPDPPYPKASRQQQEQGRVLVRVWVSADGRAQKTELAQSSGYERLDAAAQTAVAGWRFVPGRRNGQAEGMWVLVPVVFKLN